MSRLFPIAIALFIIGVPAASATGQNDAGTGADAPGTQADAVDVAPGAYTAAITHTDGDSEDWFRVTVPPGNGLRVTFTAPASRSIYVYLYRDDGAFITSASAFATTRAITAGPANTYRVSFRDCCSSSSTSYSFRLEPLAPTAAPNDAGSGADAPDGAPRAVNVSTGTFAGHLEPMFGDRVDRYHFTPPARMATHIEGRADDNAHLAVYVGGSLFGSASVSPVGGIEIPANRGEIDLVFSSSGDQFFDYAFDVASYAVPDVTVTAIEIERLQVHTAALGDAPIDTQRDVTVTVENHGLGGAGDLSLDMWTSHAQDIGGVGRHFAISVGPLAAGASISVKVRWDGTGEIGDATVHAKASATFDENTTNDERTAQSSVMVSGAGVGIDPLNTEVDAAGTRSGDRYRDGYYEFGLVTVGGQIESGLAHDDRHACVIVMNTRACADLE